MVLFKRLAFKGVQPFSFATMLALMLGSQQGHAQIPVIVTTQVTDSPMTVAEFASNTTRWAQQVQQMTSQIDQMKQQYGALTGSRGLGRVFDHPQLRDYLPQDWQAVYDAVKRGGYLDDRAQHWIAVLAHSGHKTLFFISHQAPVATFTGAWFSKC